MANITNELTLSVKELSNALNIGRNTAYELCRRKDFPSIKVGKRYVVSIDGLRRWIEAHEGKIVDVGSDKPHNNPDPAQSLKRETKSRRITGSK